MDKNQKTLLTVLLVVAGMIGLAFASVPLYDVFCRVTGFGGTPLISESAPSEDEIIDREITVYFNTDTDPNLDWSFRPEKKKITLKIGEQRLINFIAENTSDTSITGTAVYNVLPLKLGAYFHKTQCFCFDRQTLTPGQRMNMPVVFYIDPKIVENQNLDDVSTVTLSYSFFKADSKELDAALEAFYNSGD